MAQLAGDLSKAIMGQTDAEKAFRPWWDKSKLNFFKQYNYFHRWDLLEDKILYVFVCMSKWFEFQFLKNIALSDSFLGMVTLPMTFLSNVSSYLDLKESQCDSHAYDI